MNVVDFFKIEIEYMHKQEDAVMEGLTDDQFNWSPPGTANPIRATFVHLIATEDYYINRILSARERIWDQQGWGKELGLSAPPSTTRPWDEILATHISLDSVLAYAHAVREATDIYLQHLTPEELDRPVVLYGRDRIGADVLTRVFGHSLLHTGDIAAVRGLQELK